MSYCPLNPTKKSLGLVFTWQQQLLKQKIEMFLGIAIVIHPAHLEGR